jgi:hypothetical protein
VVTTKIFYGFLILIPCLPQTPPVSVPDYSSNPLTIGNAVEVLGWKTVIGTYGSMKEAESWRIRQIRRGRIH